MSNSLMKQAIIQHLSKEIEVCVNNSYLFRMRSAFSVWVGPFVLLGAVVVATKGNLSITINWISGISVVVAVLVYTLFAHLAGRIERYSHKRANILRMLLAKVASDNDVDANFHLEDLKDSVLEQKIVGAYWITFSAIFILFICTVVLISQMNFSISN